MGKKRGWGLLENSRLAIRRSQIKNNCDLLGGMGNFEELRKSNHSISIKEPVIYNDPQD